jgi:hypothetical protein
MLTMMTICTFDCVFTQNLLKYWILNMKSSKVINYDYGWWWREVHWDSWMNEIPGLVIDNEVFDDAKEMYVGTHGWMEYPIWFGQLSFWWWRKVPLGFMDEWNTWLHLDNEFFWWERRKVSWNWMNEWIDLDNEVLLSTKKITLGFVDEWNIWFGLDNEVLDDANVGTHGWMK